MTKIRIILLISFFFTSFIQLVAQNRAGVFDIRFNIDRRLVNPVQVTSGGNTIQNGGFNRVRLSEVDLDSVRQMICRTISKELNAQTECVYRTSRSGRKITTWENGTQQRGMPRNRKKQAIRDFDKDFYVRVRLNYAISTGLTLGNSVFGTSRYRPVVFLTVRAYNSERKRVYIKRVSVNDFSRLQSMQYTINGVTVRNSEVLQPQQIREMLTKTLTEFSEKQR